jgi:peptidoglycan-N-acetylglucosamine deacetylase
MKRWWFALVVLAWSDTAVAGCPGNPEALGTDRVLMVDPGATPRVGRKHFIATLPLAPKDVVLTFDDGPRPGTTERVLAALRHECVKATFFLVGMRATESPALVRRIFSDGHTVAHHTFSHRLLDDIPVAAAEAEIDRGIAAVEKALIDRLGPGPATTFFRFPGFASSPAILDRLARRGMVVFGADLWASDWNPMFPADQLHLVMQRLNAAGGGIVLFHDTKAQTAAMIPAFLRELKRQGYRVVHVVPDRPQAAALTR